MKKRKDIKPEDKVIFGILIALLVLVFFFVIFSITQRSSDNDVKEYKDAVATSVNLPLKPSVILSQIDFFIREALINEGVNPQELTIDVNRGSMLVYMLTEEDEFFSFECKNVPEFIVNSLLEGKDSNENLMWLATVKPDVNLVKGEIYF